MENKYPKVELKRSKRCYVVMQHADTQTVRHHNKLYTLVCSTRFFKDIKTE